MHKHFSLFKALKVHCVLRLKGENACQSVQLQRLTGILNSCSGKFSYHNLQTAISNITDQTFGIVKICMMFTFSLLSNMFMLDYKMFSGSSVDAPSRQAFIEEVLPQLDRLEQDTLSSA